MFTYGLHLLMIKTIKHKGLKELHKKGSTRLIGNQFKARSLMCLDLLEQADSLTELNIPSFDFHRLQGKPTRYALKVSANYRITFEWQKGAVNVYFEDYH